MKTKNESDSGIALIKMLLGKMISLKFVYIASVFFFLVLAFLYNKYALKEYELTSTLGPLKDTRSSALASSAMFNNDATPGMKLEEAINALYSFTIVSQTVNKLNLEICYYVDSTSLFRQSTEIYLESPFTVELDKAHAQTVGVKFKMTILNDRSFRLKASKRKTLRYNYLDNEILAQDRPIEFDSICKFDQVISNPDFRFTVKRNDDLFKSALHKSKEYEFELFHPEELAKQLMKKIDITPASYMASIIKIKYYSNNLEKSVAFLNNYVNSFLEDNLAKKNKIALSTINFIDSQISEMSDSLSKSESNLKNYKANTQVMDFSYQGQQLYGQSNQISSERNDLQKQIQYYKYILDYCKVNDDISGITSPTNANISDPIMTELIADLVSAYSEKSNIPHTSEKNIFLVQIENKIRNQRQTIIESATNTLNSLNITLNELNNRSERLSNEISSLPQKEMKMVNIQRKFDVNNSLYTYMLQKRQENAIVLSSTYPDYEVLEPAREITAKITKPRVKMDYMIALFLSLFFPTAYIIIVMFMSDKVSSKDDVELIIDRPILGHIYNNTKKSEAVFTEAPGSAIAESFRNLRSSLFMKLKANESKVIMVSSSQAQEGKSFIAFNLSASIASVGFKTVIIDCDLRRPVMHNKFNNDNSKGISNVLIGKVKENDVTQKTDIDNLYFIPAGPILTNPSELITAGALDELITSLKSEYEYIIIDTPPIGLVSDTIQLMKYASHIVIVTRLNHTRKDLLAGALALLDSNEISNYDVILNNLELQRSAYSSYSNYYTED